jgi:hypothetical protein
MLHLTALRKLKVMSVQLETPATKYSSWGCNPQVRLSAISDPVWGGHQVAGQVLIYPHTDLGTHSLFRMFRSGLFDVSMSVDPEYFRLLWQACSMPHEFFTASLDVTSEVVFGAEWNQIDAVFTYEIGKGKTAWDSFPSEDWIK